MNRTSLAIGILVALGTLNFGFLIADAAALLFAIYLVAVKRIFPPVVILVVAASMLPGILFGDHLLNSLHFTIRIIILAVIGRALLLNWDRKSFTLGIVAGLAGQIAVLILQFSEHRPPGFSYNATVISQTGLMLILVSPLGLLLAQSVAIIHVAIGGGRTHIGGVFLWAILNPSKRRVVITVIAVVAFVILQSLQGSPSRLSPEGIAQAVELRSEILTPKQSELDGFPKNTEAAQWVWHGYGFGSYYQTTGNVRPHNLLLLAWYELGIFSITIAGVVALLVKKRRLPIDIIILLFFTGMLVEDPFGRPEGAYYLLAVIAATWHNEWQGLRTYREAIAAIRAKLPRRLRKGRSEGRLRT